MHLAICILARNEAGTIEHLLRQLARQSLLGRKDLTVEVHLVANGCTDETASTAQRSANLLDASNARLKVHDLAQGGKSRSWNRAVHELVTPRPDLFLFLDADITLIDDDVLQSLVNALEATPQAVGCSGNPVKDISAKRRKSALDLFSLSISSQSRAEGAINGSLYAVRADALKDIWLPDQTPGEDGFLNAMLATRGFTAPPAAERVISMNRPTHHYRAHRSSDFLLHERRMIVGTMINRWIFERLWSLHLTQPAGPLIRDWNEQQPDWVDQLIAERTRGKAWVIPRAIMLGRLDLVARALSWKLPVRAAAGTLATLLTVPPAIAANRRLKQLGASSTW